MGLYLLFVIISILTLRLDFFIGLVQEFVLMIFYQVVFVLIFLFLPNFGLAIWVGDPLLEEPNANALEELNTSGAAHYHCSGSRPLEKVIFDSDSKEGASFTVDYSFTLIYPRNYNSTKIMDFLGHFQNNKSIFGYGFKMKPFLFVHGRV